MFTGTFANIPLIKWIVEKINQLLGNTEASSYSTKADIRLIVGYSENDRVLCLQNRYIYIYVPAETTADDDDVYLTPADITEPAPGRWVKDNQVSLEGHVHTDKADKVSGATADNFAGLDSAGNLIDLGTKPADYIALKPTATAGNVPVFDEYGDIVDSGLTPEEMGGGGDIDAKMDKLVGVEAGDVGNILAFDANGNAVDSGLQPRFGSVAVVEAGTEVTLLTPYVAGSTYLILASCRNVDGDVGYLISDITVSGFTVTPVVDATFSYLCIKL